MDKIYVLEWSKSQNATHIHELELALEKNLSAFVGDIKMDYIALAQGTREHCEKSRAVVMQKLKQREACRGPDTIQYHRRRDRS